MVVVVLVDGIVEDRLSNHRRQNSGSSDLSAHLPTPAAIPSTETVRSPRMSIKALIKETPHLNRAFTSSTGLVQSGISSALHVTTTTGTIVHLSSATTYVGYSRPLLVH